MFGSLDFSVTRKAIGYRKVWFRVGTCTAPATGHRLRRLSPRSTVRCGPVGNYGGERLQIIVGQGADHTNTDIPPITAARSIIES